MSDSSRPHGLQPTRLLHPWDFPGEYWSGVPLPSPRGKELACQCWRARHRGLIPGSGRSPEVGNDYPLQYSCLENFMDRAWQAIVHGISKSQAQLSETRQQQCPCRGSVPRAVPGTALLSTSGAGGPGRAALELGELWRDSRAAATSAYCWSSLMISGLSGETGRASPSGSGALGDEALCLPLLVDSREGPWEPGDKM